MFGADASVPQAPHRRWPAAETDTADDLYVQLHI
jgi:hypothetical protein